MMTAVLMTYMEERVGTIEIQNNLKGFQRLTAYVEKCQQKYKEKHQQNLTPLYRLEDVTHYGRNLAIYLLEREHVVKEMNSVLSYLERMSYPSAKKNDTWDSRCICAVLMRRYVLVLPEKAGMYRTRIRGTGNCIPYYIYWRCSKYT